MGRSKMVVEGKRMVAEFAKVLEDRHTLSELRKLEQVQVPYGIGSLVYIDTSGDSQRGHFTTDAYAVILKVSVNYEYAVLLFEECNGEVFGYAAAWYSRENLMLVDKPNREYMRLIQLYELQPDEDDDDCDLDDEFDDDEFDDDEFEEE